MPPLRIILILIAAFAAMILLWLFLAAPGRRRRETRRFASAVYAHRGLHNGRDIPENSLAAFRLAVEAGVGIELDVQLSSDGIPVVFHDNTLARVCGREGTVSDYTAQQLAEMPLLGVAGTGIPSLSEVLALVNGSVPLLVELKGELPGYLLATERTAALLDGYRGAYCIESFHPLIVAWWRRNRPTVVRGQLAMAFLREKDRRSLKYAVLELFLLNFLARPDFLAYRFTDKKRLPFRILRRLFGPAVFAWTPRGPEELALCDGFDSVIFEGTIPDRKDAPYEH
jgi:glycerophosphoryl diester phosphodiesterase